MRVFRESRPGSLFSGFSAGGVFGGLLNQQKIRPLASFRSPLLNFKKLLQDTLAYSDCNEFMSKMIAKAGELSGGKNDPVSTDIMTLYAMVNRQARGGFQLNHEGPFNAYSDKGYKPTDDLAGGGGATWGYWRTSNITIWIEQHQPPVNVSAKERARGPFRYGQTALHELFHSAGKNDTYSHPIMEASAGFFEPGLTFDRALKKHCIPPEHH